MQPRGVWKILLAVLLIAYTSALVYWMFLGFGRTVHTEGPFRYNLVPLRTVRLYFDLGNGVSFSKRLINLLGNVAVFAPFGLLLPLRVRRLQSFIRLALLAVPGILVLETLQMLLRVGSFDIDDLILNLLGVWTGYGVLLLIGRARISKR
ncbi:VanZ family protein [Paenibacillus sp. HW567]|uniref:VanZ family protein n=1 Tax=Paenibacillus sp. HW567 TaxID=1034769 RepID=UPI0003635872|nr:VanZ family protein [Paenibacillus sp. HW567]